MERTTKINGLYVIVDATFSPGRRHVDIAQAVLDGGGTNLQLRIKDATPNQYHQIQMIADEIMSLKSRYAFTFIVNDYLDVAMAVGADGIHVGENDMSVAEIKARAPGLMVGYSSHSVEEALAAERVGADYVALGAIFPTATKGVGHPVQGIERLSALVKAVAIPTVAIGGITRANIADVVKTGVDAVAMITAITKAPDMTAETRWFVDAIDRSRRS